MADASLGTRTIEEIHEQAISLWIHSKHKDETVNPAAGIYFALTDTAPPKDVTEVQNAIDLCSFLNRAFGLPGITEERRAQLNAKAVVLYHDHTKGRSPLQQVTYLVWANRIGYVLGGVALALSGISWWVLGLAAAVWLCFGAARAASGRARSEARPSWEVPAIATMHLVALAGLYVAATVHIFKG